MSDITHDNGVDRGARLESECVFYTREPRIACLSSASKKPSNCHMKISLTSVSVGDQQKALDFYTKILGFIKKTDLPLGDVRWLTVVSPEDEHGTELLLEPNAAYPAMKQLKESLVKDKIPFTAFEVTDIEAEFNRLKKLGVVFVHPPIKSTGAIQAIFDDTCGNLIQIYQVVPAPKR